MENRCHRGKPLCSEFGQNWDPTFFRNQPGDRWHFFVSRNTFCLMLKDFFFNLAMHFLSSEIQKHILKICKFNACTFFDSRSHHSACTIWRNCSCTNQKAAISHDQRPRPPFAIGSSAWCAANMTILHHCCCNRNLLHLNWENWFNRTGINFNISFNAIALQ